MTVCAWVYLNTYPTENTAGSLPPNSFMYPVVSDQWNVTGYNYGWFLGVGATRYVLNENTKRIVFGAADGLNQSLSDAGACMQGNTDLVLKKWYHIAATYDDGVVNLYLDGVFDGTKSLHGINGGVRGIAWNTSKNDDVDIGHTFHRSTDMYYDGGIQRVAIYLSLIHI